MTKLEKLYDLAYEEQITIVYANFSATKKAACLHNDYCKAIVMDKPTIKSSTEETILLAEELGHYKTGSLYMIEATINTPLTRNNRIKYESKAKRWAILELVSFNDIREAVESGNYEIYEIVEYLNLPEDTIIKAIEIYQRKGMRIKQQQDY